MTQFGSDSEGLFKVVVSFVPFQPGTTHLVRRDHVAAGRTANVAVPAGACGKGPPKLLCETAIHVLHSSYLHVGVLPKEDRWTPN